MISKVDLVEALTFLTKAQLQELFSGDLKGISNKSKSEILQRIRDNQSITKAKIRQIIFSQIDTEKYTSFIFENPSAFINPFNRYTGQLNGTSTISDTELTAAGYIEGFVKSKILCIQNYDPEEHDLDEYIKDSDFDELEFKTPFRIEFYKTFLLIKYLKIFTGSRHETSEGVKLYLHKDLLDMVDINQKIRGKLNTDFNLGPAIANLTSGIKKLVSTNKIDAVMASCDDAHNHGQNMRKLHKGSAKNFVEKIWYNNHDFHSTDKINPTNWYWTHNLPGTPKPEDCDNLWVDCSLGIIKKGKATDNHLNDFIKEILDNV